MEVKFTALKEEIVKSVEATIIKAMEGRKNDKPKTVGWVGDENEDKDDDEVGVGKVLFLEDKSRVDKMKVDTACPHSMTSADTLEKYLEANNILLDSLEVECSKKFRFGPSRIY
jgi:hypothetical protein